MFFPGSQSSEDGKDEIMKKHIGQFKMACHYRWDMPYQKKKMKNHHAQCNGCGVAGCTIGK